jgi:hypothetical protein
MDGLSWFIGFARNVVLASALQRTGWLVMTILGAAIVFVWTRILPWAERRLSLWKNEPTTKRIHILGAALTLVILLLGPSLLVTIFKEVGVPPESKIWLALPKERIYRQTFTNTTVEVDGKAFDYCNFENVTLLYRGLAPFSLTESTFSGSKVRLATSNKAVQNFAKAQDLLRAYAGAHGLQFGYGEEDEKGQFYLFGVESK